MDKTFRAGEKVTEVRLETHEYQYLFNDGELYTFMHQETYEQIALHKDSLGDAIPFMKEKKQFEISALTVIWLLWIAWMMITTAFALTPDVYVKDFEADAGLPQRLEGRVFMVAIAHDLAIRDLELHAAGVKGGVFSVLTGGGNLVWGPPGSFIEGNNALGLAMVMVLPLMYYLWSHATDRYIRMGLVGSMALSFNTSIFIHMGP